MRKFEEWIQKNCSIDDDFYFIQIGANDGVSDGGEDPDPIHSHILKFNWAGILVEPVKYIYEELRRTYASQSNLHFENSALNMNSGSRNIYRLRKTDDPLPWFYEKLATFHKDVLIKHKVFIPNILNYIVEEQITCITFDELIRRYNVQKIDLLVIDTEGHDYEILKTINFNYLRPKAIFLEHFHLNKDELAECKDLLKKNCYKLHLSERDIFAC